MGSIVSYLFGSEPAPDEDNDNEDVTTIRSLLLQVPELSSEEEPTAQQWEAILRRIEDHPEEAALFCHGRESSRELPCRVVVLSLSAS